MSAQRLTDILMRNLKPPTSGQYVVYDDLVPGFGARVSQGGRVSFILLYRVGDHRKRATLGPWPIISLSDARSQAKKILAKVTLDEHPIAKASTITFREAVELFLSTHVIPNNRERTRQETERLLRKHWLPAFGNKVLSTITHHDVIRVTDALMDRPAAATHAFVVARTLFNWAKKRRYITSSPCEGLRLPRSPVSRDRLLADDEVARIHSAAREIGYPYGYFVRLLLYTGMRRNEAAKLRWEFVSHDGIAIPGELSKNGEPRTVPLTPLSHALIKEIPRLNEHFVFPARGNSEGTFSGFSKSKRDLDTKCQVEEWVLHDFRRYLSSTLARLGTPLIVTEKLLGHTTGSMSPVARIYNRHQYLDEMRKAMETYDLHLAGIFPAKSVLLLNGSAGVSFPTSAELRNRKNGC